MAHLATDLIRTTARAFHSPEHCIVVDALVVHSTLTDNDLAQVCGVQPKLLRRWCGTLREAGLISVQQRGERRADGTGGYHGGVAQAGKERLSNRDWYYLNYHRAIDSIKYRMNKLSKHIESLGMPTTEKKELSCRRCKGQYTELEVMDNLDENCAFRCPRCQFVLDHVQEEELVTENESMKRMNQQLEKLLKLMQQIDASAVPENDFQTALSKQKPIIRHDANPGAKTEVVDVPNRNLQSTKGLEIKPEKIAVQVQNDNDIKRETALAEAQARKEREAKQNALPDWITHSTVAPGEITTVGAKQAHQERQREAQGAIISKAEESEEIKPAVGEDDAMAMYWKQLEAEKAQEAQKAREEEEDDGDDDDDEGEFEDVDVSGGGMTPANGKAGVAAPSTGMNTPLNAESSNATDDERDSKRPRIQEPAEPDVLLNTANGEAEKPAEGTPAASDEDEDDELEFENVR